MTDNIRPFNRGDEGEYAGSHDTEPALPPMPDFKAARTIQNMQVGVFLIGTDYQTILKIDDMVFILHDDQVYDLHWQAGAATGIAQAFGMFADKLIAANASPEVSAQLLVRGLMMSNSE